MTPEEIQQQAIQLADANSYHHREYWRLTISGPSAGSLADRLNEQLRSRHFDIDMKFSCKSCVQEGHYYYDAGVWHVDDLLLFFFGSVTPPFKETVAEKYVLMWLRGGTYTDCYPVSET